MRRGSFDLQGFYREVDRAYGAADPVAVVHVLRDAIDGACVSSDPLALAAVASELGSVLRARGELELAEKLYLAALPAVDRAWDRSPLSRCTMRINLGDVYLAQGRGCDAVAAFDQAEVFLSRPEDHPYELSAICNNRASAYRLCGMLTEARRDLARAIAVLEGVPGTAGERAVHAVNLAQILTEEGKLDEAAAALEPALKAYETLSGGRDIHRPQAFAAAGRIAYLKGDYARCRDCYSNAIAAVEDKLGMAPIVQQLEAERDRADRLAREARR